MRLRSHSFITIGGPGISLVALLCICQALCSTAARQDDCALFLYSMTFLTCLCMPKDLFSDVEGSQI